MNEKFTKLFKEIRIGLESHFIASVIQYINDDGHYLTVRVPALSQKTKGVVRVFLTSDKVTEIPIRRIVKVEHDDPIWQGVLNLILHEYKTFLLEEGAREIAELLERPEEYKEQLRTELKNKTPPPSLAPPDEYSTNTGVPRDVEHDEAPPEPPPNLVFKGNKEVSKDEK